VVAGRLLMLQASKTTCQIAPFFRREERQASWKKLQGYVLEEEDGGQDTGQVDQVCKSSKVAGPLACYDYRQLPNSGGFEVRILPTAWDRGHSPGCSKRARLSFTQRVTRHQHCAEVRAHRWCTAVTWNQRSSGSSLRSSPTNGAQRDQGCPFTPTGNVLRLGPEYWNEAFAGSPTCLQYRFDTRAEWSQYFQVMFDRPQVPFWWR